MLTRHLMSMSMLVFIIFTVVILLDPWPRSRRLPWTLMAAGKEAVGALDSTPAFRTAPVAHSGQAPSTNMAKDSRVEPRAERALSPGRFETLPPGAALPSGSDCASRVRPSTGEARPLNAQANRASGGRIQSIAGLSPARNALFAPRIDGGFGGTTDEILQWGACKWGLDEDVVRAIAVQESYWRQSTLGDFQNGEYQTFGLMQIKRTVHLGTWPLSAQSTAFNVDYSLAWQRACFEGDLGWFNQVQPDAGYKAGDLWGCIGAWFSGRWYDPASLNHITRVRLSLTQRTWLNPDF